ncbi:heterodisulfide reductase-related iron-sulfur binding cluster [Anaerotardibacter muris]|uniref:heterodisulfide reductase-related iron-sulfur binding cluster n=1 Tax=Anaerotardibacter muris TaxID=2941505 RepID=UPI00204158B9|nr:heterodisulfide reductase-related iron-sulfur binding cluster [Anaerotardibacter muris]
MQEATRELYWNIPSHWFMYVLFVGVVVCFAIFFYRRYRLWKLGAPEELSDHKSERFFGAFKEVFTQKRVVRKKSSGIMHLFIFWGMLFLLVATTLVALQDHFGIPILYGDFYLYFISLGIDLAGLVCIVGVIIALVRRAAKINSNLETNTADIVWLALLLVILLSGFATEGLRIVGTNDPWAIWSPVGYVFALMFSGMSPEALSLTHQIIWWGHLVLAFAFLAFFTYSKMAHVLFIPGNYYYRSLKPAGTLEPIDFEDEELETMGVRTLEEYTWKDLLDAQACIKCGRCQENCPAYLSGKELSPMRFIQNMAAQNLERGKILLKVPEDARTEEQQTLLEEGVVGTVISEEALWQCTTCRSCSEECPARVVHPEKDIKARTYQVCMESAFPPEAQQTFRNLETNGNPWGIGWQKRTEWTKDLDVPTIEENPNAEYLYWPGCSGAYDARSRKVSTAFVQLMKQAGVDFAILGNAEKCCGDSARRLGNEYVYYMLAQENIETLKQAGVKKIVTQCPHCLQALSVDYPQMGGNFEVLHHSELLAQLIAEGKLKAGSCEYAQVTYHDSCYLGRYHGQYDAPRNVLKQGAGAQLVEMERNESKSFCCGAGGGHMWLEEPQGTKINDMRAEQALQTKADALVTACPFCLTMLTDGVAAHDSQMPVKDLAEVLAEAQFE